MSRSIHETRQSWKRLYRFDYTDPKERKAALGQIYDQLRKKRRIKRAVHKARDILPPAPETAAPTPAVFVPIHCAESASFLHHGASPDDVSAILQLLPPAASEGIASIQLNLGKEYLEEQAEEDERGDEGTRDPFFARVSHSLFPGCYSPNILGTYFGRTGVIGIYAYVWDRATLAPAVVIEFDLRLRGLSTLIHEVAHHHDETHRRARGRWRGDREATSEMYAEKMEWTWMEEIVFPYLTSRYATEWEQVRQWIHHHGGVEPTLRLLVGDPRWTVRDGAIRFMASHFSATEDLIESVSKGESRDESRLAYAWGLHYADAYETCLAISTVLLEENPDSLPALILHADTLEHLDRLDEARLFIDRALSFEPHHPRALENKAKILEASQDWVALLPLCATLIEVVRKENVFRLAQVYKRKAVALCALGFLDEMEKLITEIALLIPRSTPVQLRNATRRRAAIPLL